MLICVGSNLVQRGLDTKEALIDLFKLSKYAGSCYIWWTASILSMHLGFVPFSWGLHDLSHRLAIRYRKFSFRMLIYASISWKMYCSLLPNAANICSLNYLIANGSAVFQIEPIKRPACLLVLFYCAAMGTAVIHCNYTFALKSSSGTC